ncbi:MAG TPA: hypothetical protein VMO17_08500 [Terriglobia bacterium]|nr:hypothetical protein [Terriglobia bacterium]
MRAKLAGFVCLLLVIQPAPAQGPLLPKTLTPATIHDVMAPPFTFWGNPACDKDGNMYFHVGGSAVAEVLRLSADGSEGKIFKVAEDSPGAKGFVFQDFSVSPKGEVNILGGITGESTRIMVMHFHQDGSMDEPIYPQIPKSAFPTNVVTSDAGTVLLFGYYDDTAPRGLKKTSYLAILDSSGTPRQEVHAAVPGLDIAKLASGETPAPAATLGEDGNFYLPGSNEILVMLPDGELVRGIPFDNPEPKSMVGRLIVSGKLIIIVLDSYINRAGHADYLVLLNPSGGVVGYYQPSEELGGWRAMCYSPQQGLIFLKVDHKRLKLLTVPLR